MTKNLYWIVAVCIWGWKFCKWKFTHNPAQLYTMTKFLENSFHVLGCIDLCYIRRTIILLKSLLMTGLHAAVLQYSTVIATQHWHRMVVCNNLGISSSMPHDSDHVALQLVTVELRFARNICARIGVCAGGDENLNVYKVFWRPKAA